MSRLSKRIITAAGVFAVLVLVFVAYSHYQKQKLEERLLDTFSDQIAADATLVQFASSKAKPIYAEHCASCHGKDLQGNLQQGAPDLTDPAAYYYSNTIFAIETSILYGIRSGNKRGHNLADMPALGQERIVHPEELSIPADKNASVTKPLKTKPMELGLTHQLSADEIKDVRSFVYWLSKASVSQPTIVDAQAVNRGRAIFNNKGFCYDCHAADGKGNTDYGAPDLTQRHWHYGSDPDTVYETIFNGRHGICPAWIDQLALLDIRALAVYLNSVQKPAKSLPAS